jgi:membrane protease YdiL (CAAX protease family)
MLVLAMVTLLVTDGVEAGSDSYVLLMFGSFIVTIVIALFVITKVEKRSLRGIGFSRENIVSSLLMGLGLGFGMFLLVVVIGMALGQYSFEGYDLSSLNLAIPYIIVFIIQPFAEEIYTRGWIIPLFSKNYSVLVAVAVSVFFFISGHVGNNGFNVLSIVNILLFGLLLSLLFLKVDNIWICGALHSAWNFTQSYLFGFNVSGIETSSILHFGQNAPNIINGGAFGPEAGLITSFITLVTMIIVWKVDINRILS